MNSALAIIFGILFGFILQRAGAMEYKNIIKTLRLMDLSVAKFMFLSVGVSAVGVFSLRTMGLVTLDMIKFNLFGTLVGGLIFGIGFAIAGYCPGTCLGAWVEGKKDAAFVILGGIAGVLAYTVIQEDILTYISRFDMGELMLGDFISLNTLAVGAFYSVAIGIIIYTADRMELKNKERRSAAVQQETAE